MRNEPWRWACPACRTPLLYHATAELQCPAEKTVYHREGGIWRFLTPANLAHYARFVREYDVVRTGENWGSEHEAYYRALPYRDLSGQHPEIWRIRVISFGSLLRQVVQPLAAQRGRALQIADAGAGNCWLSYRLAAEGHDVLATDLRLSEADGLGAFKWYAEDARFTPAQAAFEAIPLVDDQLDLVIFAGSFHYATDYATVLREALRILRPDGSVVLMESPVYRQEKSGEQMVRELHSRLRAEHGIGADAIEHENYLTLPRIQTLGAQLGLRWRVIKPFYGWRWALAPWLAKLKRRREPARFYLFVGQSG
jgi:SAM-dependent methyltransferase